VGAGAKRRRERQAAAGTNAGATAAWQLVTALTIGYLLSRGLARSGSRHREDRDTI
jgi:hypothetical protein